MTMTTMRTTSRLATAVLPRPRVAVVAQRRNSGWLAMGSCNGSFVHIDGTATTPTTRRSRSRTT
jgi:hypothetical protein